MRYKFIYMYINLLCGDVHLYCAAVRLTTHFPNLVNLEVAPHQLAEPLIGCTHMSCDVLLCLMRPFCLSWLHCSTHASLVEGYYHCHYVLKYK